mmetsp:Transcript_14810/g.37413  ORF Transcript_14810/g.37413 Transcript_14810/m.37413 type:complete len:241 (+) Transcript_14810:389-1111(+)
MEAGKSSTRTAGGRMSSACVSPLPWQPIMMSSLAASSSCAATPGRSWKRTSDASNRPSARSASITASLNAADSLRFELPRSTTPTRSSRVAAPTPIGAPDAGKFDKSCVLGGSRTPMPASSASRNEPACGLTTCACAASILFRCAEGALRWHVIRLETAAASISSAERRAAFCQSEGRTNETLGKTACAICRSMRPLGRSAEMSTSRVLPPTKSSRVAVAPGKKAARTAHRPSRCSITWK